MAIPDFLKRVPLFSNLSEEDVERLAESIERVELPGGEMLFTQGSPGDKAYIIQEGELEILRESEGRKVLLAVRKAGEVIGEMSILHEAPRMASVRARKDSLLLALGQEQLDDLLNSSPSATRAMLHTISSRLKATESMLRQSEKIAQLGTLTAGVAHELNNPAAAVQRGAGQLKEILQHFQESTEGMAKIELSPEQLTRLEEVDQIVREHALQPEDLSTLERGDREMEMEDWLEAHHFEEPWELAPVLVGVGFDEAKLEDLASSFDAGQLQVLIPWICDRYDVYSLLEEVEQGAKQISQIVKALKTYAYLDQAPVQMVDVHEGLDNTLIMLRSKLKKGIDVQRKYAQDLPRIQAYGSELNQVWTNLIDNAVDALEGQGEIEIRTRSEGDWVVVEIIDNGPGIPVEIQGKIFDTFFTTKGPGKGTGLGLDISYNIVVQRHRGDIRVTSEPGRTCFEVWLPVNFEAVDSGKTTVPALERAADAKKTEILFKYHNVAVVGVSTRPGQPAHDVPAYLMKRGYHIFPVREDEPEVFGQKAYPDLASIPNSVDIVLIFKRRSEVPSIVEQAISIGAKVVWMQEGILHEGAAAAARRAGLEVIMDTCMRTEHLRLMEVD
jgi:signal transduction histidine kinase/predicted CoA-binding protein